eukprot:7763241-Pyramimonas_sp.AAC.1
MHRSSSTANATLLPSAVNPWGTCWMLASAATRAPASVWAALARVCSSDARFVASVTASSLDSA